MNYYRIAGNPKPSRSPSARPRQDGLAARLQKDYYKRKWIAEPPNGWIKNVLGFRQFSMRGLEKAKAEFKLVCMAQNLRRMGPCKPGETENVQRSARHDFLTRLGHFNHPMKISGGECLHHRLCRYRLLGASGIHSQCSAAQTPRARKFSNDYAHLLPENLQEAVQLSPLAPLTVY